ncbi:digalactosyldiacylglycerol synthase 2, chloroplastic [Cucurbita maxima]|uniref:Digalactosyldiacylglycerol synthase 2, chloroplastic n=1 Tax=Cucurbita maxima TaxID=3661 RepID=A0A6J1IFT4_CUCMA|nr:digalactosyldiacylglycerol synthase 2, chloroplastic [Cucurbita maxima]XP_022975106.1 digalactosyldiacylglycerol synthase 2, chloroplastic [Cucurbita maxima]XP_022975107.1 digalactosyldiacylglycerol synthase 2, chloroplastic [Cucurbita maxima]
MDTKQHIAIFTTASLPWMTGTAVNPLFRAAYLSIGEDRKVTLVVPWLSKRDQELVYPSNTTFVLPSQQEKYIREWLEERIGSKFNFNLQFYPGKFAVDKRSILPVGDISEIIPDDESDIAILEEPEHLTWYHHGRRWKKKFKWVVGIIHTNYLEYVKREKNGAVEAFLLEHINRWVVHIYCHKVIRLSAATQDYPKSVICNVHGVNPKFLEIGKKKMEQRQDEEQVFGKGVYYIGKMIWSKGYRELLKLLSDHQKDLAGIEVDLFGNGEDSDEVQKAARDLELSVKVHPGRDHTDPIFHDYKVFVNPSTTDVVCTTTAEALAMGKFVVCADHPSNEFFRQFPNCFLCDKSDAFVRGIFKALTEEPEPLTNVQMHELSWEAATERFLTAAELDQPLAKKPQRTRSKKFLSMSLQLGRKFDDASAYIHHVTLGFEGSRRAFGAVPGSLHPDEQQCKELGIASPSGKRGSKK